MKRERVEEGEGLGKSGGGKGWRRERVEEGKGGEEKGTAGWWREGGDWGGIVHSKNFFKKPWS